MTDATTLLANIQADTNEVCPLNSGERLSGFAQTTPFAENDGGGATKVRTYTINLDESILGSPCQINTFHYLLCQVHHLRLGIATCKSPMLQNSFAGEKVLADSPNSFTVSNCEFIGNFMELGSEGYEHNLK